MVPFLALLRARACHTRDNKIEIYAVIRNATGEFGGFLKEKGTFFLTEALGM